MRQNEAIIKTITSFGSSLASIYWTIPTASSKTIFVKIDPLNTLINSFVGKILTRNFSKILQENYSLSDRFLFSFMVKHPVTCSGCSHGDNVMYYGRF